MRTRGQLVAIIRPAIRVRNLHVPGLVNARDGAFRQLCVDRMRVAGGIGSLKLSGLPDEIQLGRKRPPSVRSTRQLGKTVSRGRKQDIETEIRRLSRRDE